MTSFKKTVPLFAFILIAGIKAYSQDSISANKYLYGVSADKLQEYNSRMELEKDQQNKNATNLNKNETGSKPQLEQKSFFSCEVNTQTNKAIVSKIDKNGKITQEEFELKEIPKAKNNNSTK